MCLCQRAMLSGMRSFSSSSVASGLGREHHTLELVFLLRSSAVEQSCSLAGVEMQVRLPSIGVAYEVILRLLEFRIRDDISIEQSLAIFSCSARWLPSLRRSKSGPRA